MGQEGALRPVLEASGGRRFICRGCYYIYDEAEGAPDAATPQMPFEAVPADWRCPDCGAEKAIFRPYGEARRQA